MMSTMHLFRPKTWSAYESDLLPHRAVAAAKRCCPGPAVEDDEGAVGLLTGGDLEAGLVVVVGGRTSGKADQASACSGTSQGRWYRGWATPCRMAVDIQQGLVEVWLHLEEEELDLGEAVEDLAVEELGHELVWQLAGPS